jgi:hypothetical protein
MKDWFAFCNTICMKRLIFLLPFLFITHAITAQVLSNTKEPVFKVGEELQYRVKYGFITAAEATLQVQDTDVEFNGQEVQHLIAQGKTSGTFDIFYKVRNRYDSYIDKGLLVPYLYTENIREANYRRNDKVRFYPDQQKIVGNKGTFKGAKQTFDLVSAYYFARSLNLTGISVGEYLKMNYFLDDGVTELSIQYLGKERIKTSLGYFNCLKFSPSIQPGRIFRKDSKLYLWITDDGNRIPVKAQAEILIGSLTLEISGAKGLKYPLK